ncbi:tRNA (adenine(58)-N(1))-methyltransferase non-catalytic subunit trm6 [Agyrium rufum]|nr:tRNA (adenine(58)-N(1))-methyltransferase non-catalytic subunit trm6 [Agyrium rufum]
MGDFIQPSAYVVLRLPSGSTTIEQLKPNTAISLGKYGSFPVNAILGRPYYLTFEILDQSERSDASPLRIVSANEIHATVLAEEAATAPESEGTALPSDGQDGVQFDVADDGKLIMRSNRQTVDDPQSQKLTMEEIELLKQQDTGSGKNLVAKILESHTAIDQKTAFALAKYTLRKTKKYLKRFTVLPMDVPTLLQWISNEKEPSKVLDIREELLALTCSWSNVRLTVEVSAMTGNRGPCGRWLVVDETGGLVVAALAERMGILHVNSERQSRTSNIHVDQSRKAESMENSEKAEAILLHRTEDAMSAESNTITLVHANSQPNLSLLKYFGFDFTSVSESHPLYTHLKTLTWLQLLHPEEDATYDSPGDISEDTLRAMKSSKRGAHYRKRRRWQRVKSLIDETRAGDFDGLIVASAMKSSSILHHTLPLLRGGAQVVVYSPNIEPLAETMDYYSTARRAAFVMSPPDSRDIPNEDFPVNPTFLLSPMTFTARCREWQVLPGRTHPLMMGRGGAEGYVFTATRVLPAEGKVEARGRFKRRKTVLKEGNLTDYTLGQEEILVGSEEVESPMSS